VVVSMTSWRELPQADGRRLDEALGLVLSEGRALIASVAETGGAERVERVNGLSEDQLRAMAYAAAAPS
jgi:hypothetical protein